LRPAITQIVIADLSMSIDNVLAIASAARDHPYILVMMYEDTVHILNLGKV